MHWATVDIALPFRVHEIKSNQESAKCQDSIQSPQLGFHATQHCTIGHIYTSIQVIQDLKTQHPLHPWNSQTVPSDSFLRDFKLPVRHRWYSTPHVVCHTCIYIQHIQYVIHVHLHVHTALQWSQVVLYPTCSMSYMYIHVQYMQCTGKQRPHISGLSPGMLKSGTVTYKTFSFDVL